MSVFVDVMFMLVLDQVKNHFDLAKYDADNQKTYDLMPEQRDEPPLTKASRWFGSLIDGDALIQMVDAFNEAIVNFTPNESRRAALRAVLDKERETEKLEAEYRIKLVNQMFDQTKDGLDKRWKQLTETQLTRLEKTLDGRFDSFTAVPESSG
ncbi:hypothetical protein FACS1894189_5150 [Planctomycetales bacterium]|nr:hypothetical protein FACS1894189_5150 [Planctomycetales bacterium]